MLQPDFAAFFLSGSIFAGGLWLLQAGCFQISRQLASGISEGNVATSDPKMIRCIASRDKARS
jgi:hypothetical protein